MKQSFGFALMICLTVALSAQTKEPTPAVRKDFAVSLEQTLLDLGNDTHCYTKGTLSEELYVEGLYVNRVFANDFVKMEEGKLWRLVVALKFSKVIFKSTATGKWVSYDTETHP